MAWAEQAPDIVMRFRIVVVLLLYFGCHVAADLIPRSVGSRSMSCIKSSIQRAAVGCASFGVAAVTIDARITESLVCDMSQLRRTVANGDIYIQDRALPRNLFEALREDAKQAKKMGKFKVSGLTNRADNGDSFNSKDDRTVCPILGSSGYRSSALGRVKTILDNFRSTLASPTGLNRPTMIDDSLGHEMYYSSAVPGAFLKRHLDERHPELSRRGYLGSSRRSVSFLIYLTDDEWSDKNGGHLRGFPQIGRTSHDVGGSFEDCLQVAWLLDRNCNRVYQVFLDSWKAANSISDHPYCELFLLHKSKTLVRHTISSPFFSLEGGSTLQSNLESHLLPEYRNSRYSIYHLEELDAELPTNTEVVDVAPLPNRLVMFDSVILPHQVQRTLVGERVALAGWYHEMSPRIPALYS